MNTESTNNTSEALLEMLKAQAKRTTPARWMPGVGIVAALGVTGAGFTRSALGGVVGVLVAQQLRKYLDEKKQQAG